MGDWFAAGAADGSLSSRSRSQRSLAWSPSSRHAWSRPGYLSYVSGLSGADLQAARRGRVLAGASLFVLGFSAVFISYGALLGAIGFPLIEYQTQINVVLGLLTIAMGFVFIGVHPVRPARRAHPRRAQGRCRGCTCARRDVWGGLDPVCRPDADRRADVGNHHWWRSPRSTLTVFHSLGLGLPFIAAAVGYRRMLGTLSWVRDHHRAATRFGGADDDRRRNPAADPALPLPTTRCATSHGWKCASKCGGSDAGWTRSRPCWR